MPWVETHSYQEKCLRCEGEGMVPAARELCDEPGRASWKSFRRRAKGNARFLKLILRGVISPVSCPDCAGSGKMRVRTSQFVPETPG